MTQSDTFSFGKASGIEVITPSLATVTGSSRSRTIRIEPLISSGKSNISLRITRSNPGKCLGGLYYVGLITPAHKLSHSIGRAGIDTAWGIQDAKSSKISFGCGAREFLDSDVITLETDCDAKTITIFRNKGQRREASLKQELPFDKFYFAVTLFNTKSKVEIVSGEVCVTEAVDIGDDNLAWRVGERLMCYC